MIGSVDVLSLVTPVCVVVVIVGWGTCCPVPVCMFSFSYLNDVNMLAILEAVVIF
jgi:hypothetical protein